MELPIIEMSSAYPFGISQPSV